MQSSSLHHEEQYFIDCAAEYGEITPAAWYAIMLWGDRARVEAIISAPQRGRGWRASRKITCLALEDYATELTLSMPIEIQRAMMACAVVHSAKWISDAADALIYWNFDDSTRGGALRGFRKVCLCDHNYNPTPRAKRRLFARRAIRRYVKMDAESVPHMVDLAHRLRRLPWPESMSEYRIIMDMLAEQREAIRRRQVDAQRAAMDRVLNRGKPYRVIRKERRQLRRKIIRSAAIASAVLGASAVSAFARGEPVEMRGERMILEAAPSSSIGRDGHGACNLTIKDIDGEPLGSLCCYFDKTPALDQLAAFALHMAAGEEDTVLEIGNVYAVTQAGATHPLIAGRIKAPIQGPPILDGERRRAALERYKSATKHIYVDAVEKAVWGRDAARVISLTEGFFHE